MVFGNTKSRKTPKSCDYYSFESIYNSMSGSRAFEYSKTKERDNSGTSVMKEVPRAHHFTKTY